MSQRTCKETHMYTFLSPLLHRASIPFQQAHHLVNPWNDHKKVQISRDGQVSQIVVKCKRQMPPPGFHVMKFKFEAVKMCKRKKKCSNNSGKPNLELIYVSG